jgi:lipopolysaccharide export system permease protein
MSGQLQFFPSRTIAWYMARLFLIRTFAVLAGLVLILQTLDMLGESGKVLAYPGNGDAELWQYASLRVPQIIARFLPFSVLLGTIITLATLNQNSEIISMKAAGISAHQILAPLIVASLAIAMLSFVFNERIVVRSNQTLNAWEAAEYGPVDRRAVVIGNVWVRDGDDIIHVTSVTGSGDATLLSGVEIFERQGGSLIATTRATGARRDGKGWALTGTIQRFDVAAGAPTPRTNPHFGDGITPDQYSLSNVKADEMALQPLRHAIANLKKAGRPTGALVAGLWHKISGPLAIMLMPLLAGVAAFGLARSGKLFWRAVIGMGLGFAYFVADNFGLAMGNLGAYPGWLAAWGPFMLFFLIGELVLVSTEE